MGIGEQLKAERKAQARSESPVDLGLTFQRTMQMTEGSLDMLQMEFVEFQSAKKGIPRGFMENLKALADLLNSLTLAYSRYRKAEDEWAERMSVEEKLESMRGFLLALHKDQPDLARQWASQTALALNHATAATLGVVKTVARRPSDQETFEALDPGDAAWAG